MSARRTNVKTASYLFIFNDFELAKDYIGHLCATGREPAALDLAEEAFSQWDQNPIFGELLADLYLSGHPQAPWRARAVFDRLVASGTSPSQGLCNRLISAFAETGQWQEAHGLFHWLLGNKGQPEDKVANLLLGSLIQGNQLKEAICLFTWMCQQPIPPVPEVCNRLIIACVDANQLATAHEVFQCMGAHGLTTDDLACTRRSAAAVAASIRPG
jgi:hypothetical protein